MKQAIIDIGSNSIRLTLYEVSGTAFKVLFRNRIMAGLAGYVEDGTLTEDGIRCAEQALLEFRDTLQCLDIEHVSLFATASLRNIANTDDAVLALQKTTGFDIVIIEGRTEACLGYYGAMLELKISSGAFLDIGGASTELISFTGGRIVSSVSYPFGSLSLYKNCVKKIIPGSGSIKRMNQVITSEIRTGGSFIFDHRSPLVCVGGTARTLLKITQNLYHLPASARTITAMQVDEIYEILTCGSKASYRLILKLEPERIHTLIPGLLILRRMIRLFDSEEIVVSKYGVREGYLCQKIMPELTADTPTHKTES